MNAPATEHWLDFFPAPAPGQPATTLKLHVVRRGGEPFLYLPAQAGPAAKALALYPAQTTKARWARRLLGFALRGRVALLRERLELIVDERAPFPRFLAQTAGTPGLPIVGVLAGNPRAPGRRFVFLVFDSAGQPVAVVKAGATEAARQLIQSEVEFLGAVPPMTPGIPRPRSRLKSPQVHAFALDYFSGSSPCANDSQPLAALLNAWLAEDRHVRLGQLTQWRQLLATGANPPSPVAPASLSELILHPTLAHGDLAPWNVKASGGRWTVIDWERGGLDGVPGWDWFHFVLQPAVLVERASPDELLARLERLLASPDFSAYARRAGISGYERALAVGYLAYCTRVIGQTEGTERITALEQAARARWFPEVR